MGESHGVKGKSCEHRTAEESEKNSPSGGYVPLTHGLLVLLFKIITVSRTYEVTRIAAMSEWSLCIVYASNRRFRLVILSKMFIYLIISIVLVSSNSHAYEP